MLQELEPVLKQLNESRERLNRTLDGMTEAEAIELRVSPDWTIKDAVAHLVGAERGMTRIAQRMAKGENPQLPEGYNNDEYNARQVGKRKDQSLAQIRAEADTARAELLALMQTITSDQLTLKGEHPLFKNLSLKELFGVIQWHASTHTYEITTHYHESKK